MPTEMTMTSGPGMAELIEDSIRAVPVRVAIAVADGSLRLTYRQLDRLLRMLADKLGDAGMIPGTTVALYCDNCPEFAIALLAAWAAGATVVPVDPQLTASEVHARLAATGAAAVLCPQRLAGRYPAGDGMPPAWAIGIEDGGTSVGIEGMDHGSPAGAAESPSTLRSAGPQPHPGAAILLFTTGSTGNAKIVPLTHANLAASAASIVSRYHLGADDATLIIMPLFHGHGLVAGLLATLASGGAAYLPAASRFSAHLFWPEIARAKATWYTAVPTVHQILLARADTEYPGANPPALRFIRSCSAPLAPAVAHRIEGHFGTPVIAAYGMTETAHQAASNPLPADGLCKDASVGLASGLQIRITTDRGDQAAAGETGEVCVRGHALASGYLNDPEATAAAFTGGWFHTGDLGHLDDDGYLFLTGRIREMINRGGEKIAPDTVEAALLAHPAVQEAVAFAMPDPKYGEAVNAAVILRPGMQATEADLQQHCRATLASFEIPARIYFPSRFPRTVKGSPDRRAIAAALAGHHD